MFRKSLMRAISTVLAVLMLVTLSVGCGSSDTTNDTSSSVSQNTAANSSTAANVEKSKVDFWYLWGGAEQQKVENFIKSFNSSQAKYEVTGLYIADMQKVKVAIAGGTGPDITDDFDGNIASYADQGIMEPLDDYIKKDGLKFDDYVSGTLDAWKYKDQVYALPAGLNYFMMYYNKTLLKNAGYNEPPKTQEELMDMAIKTTEVNADKSIKVLGFPEFPIVYYLSNMVFASGGKYYTDDVKFNPENPAIISSLNFIRTYREKFGVDNVLKFTQSGKYNEATDPFMTGNQVFRFDGLWLANSIRNDLKIGTDKLDFGICPIPYPKDKTELANSAQLTSGIFYIPSNAKNKDGAWELMKYTQSEFCKYMNSLPILKSQMDLPEFQSIQGIKEFGAFAKVAKFSSNPPDSKAVELFKLLNDQAELVMNMKISSEDAMKETAEKSKSITGN